MTGFILWYVSFVYDVIQTVGRSGHILILVCIAICTHVYADPPIHHKTNGYYLGTHKLRITPV